jgi:hypothetical protein
MLLINKRIIGMPKEAFIVSDDEDYLVKMSTKFPYNVGDDHFFVHINNLDKWWIPAEKGVQTEIFK